MPTGPRPYGTGPYGKGPYSRYGAAIYEMAAATGITFDVHAAASTVALLHAASGIVFDARSMGIARVLQPEAVTEIAFGTQAFLAWTWGAWAPWETGGWNAAAPCDGGLWAAPGGCGVGTWTEQRLP